MAFIGMAAYFLTRPHDVIQWLDKIVFLPFFVGAVACLGLSFAFHTLHCHSERVGKIFSKLDYVGITLLIMGSFVPWLYYGFYCRLESQVGYISAILMLGLCCVVVSLWDKFSQPKFRPLRAGLFVGLGLSGLVPCSHYFIVNGFWSAVYEASMGWLVLMACLYIGGALFYAFRVPERFFPGKCDIMFQSHQIFHLLVVAAAFVHYHGVTEMAVQRLSAGTCEEVTNGQLFQQLLSYQDQNPGFDPAVFKIGEEL
uniref:Adiponectin receptor n=1 Tax=Romanomermis culicivorax TaxID=13658 RepID=A0A915JBB3_ROMCU